MSAPSLLLLLLPVVLLAAIVPAHAQLGTENNPPSQHIFNFRDTPALRNNGLGTMAERRARLQALHRHRTTVTR